MIMPVRTAKSKKRSRPRSRTPMVERRDEMLVTIAAAFSELGYRRATTAELAQRCDVPENVLYRVWPSKQVMFAAVIEHIYDRTIACWEKMLEETGATDRAEAILAYEAVHHGENRLYRIIFAGLTESSDPAIHAALQSMYRRFNHYIEKLINDHRGGRRDNAPLSASHAAWAIIGVGLVDEVGRELKLIGSRERGRIIQNAGTLFLGDKATRQ